MSDFYRNLLNKNEAFGAGARSIAVPAREDPPSSSADDVMTGQGAKVVVSGDLTQASKEGLRDSKSAASESIERESEQRPEAERARSSEASYQEEEDGQPASRKDQDEPVVSRKKEISPGAQVKPIAKEERGAPSERATKTDAVAEAKARYLARKRQRT